MEKVKGNFYSRETENNQLEFDELINRPIANLTYNSEGKLEVVNKYWCRQFPKYTPL